MAGPIKDFSSIKSLRKEIKAQDEARQAAADETLGFSRNGIGPDVMRKLRRGH